MSVIINNIKIFSSFWMLLSLYFIIPLFIESIKTPSWFYCLDSSIPFISWMIIPYYFYYILILIPPLIWKDEWKIRNITSVLNVMTIICYIIFMVLPLDTIYVLNQVQEIEPSLIMFFHKIITYDYLYQNAFPSMHVTIATFLCLSYYYDFTRLRILSLIIAFLIFLSTFLIKQHYFIDSITGLFLGLSGFYYYVIRTKSCI